MIILMDQNPVGFATTSLSGTHKFLVGELKNTISEIKVVDGGNLTNRKLLVKTFWNINIRLFNKF